jgi:Flp pilus assembly protein TadG
MLHSFHRRARAIGRNRRGVSAPLVALVLPVMLGSIGFAVDTARIQINRTALQSAADAAATAAAKQIGTPSNIADTAIQLAVANLPTSKNGSVLSASDVVPGYWKPTDRTFTPNSVTPANNAVQVTTRYAAANGNQMKLAFGAILGFPALDVSASAIALLKTGCQTATNYSQLSTGLPTRNAVVTQGQPCLPGSGWAGSCFWAFKPDATKNEGNPIIRIDSGYPGGPSVITFKLASPANLAKTYTFNSPGQGQYWVVLTDLLLPNSASVNLVFNAVSSVPAYTSSGGTATYSNKFNLSQTLPGTALCIPGTAKYSASLVN